MSFQIGDKVLLRSVNIRTLHPKKKKIDHRQLGPFTISAKKGKQAYQLDLPAKYKAIHATFHVSLLEPWYSGGEDPKPGPILIEGEEECDVDKVLDKRTKQRYLTNRRLRFLVVLKHI